MVGWIIVILVVAAAMFIAGRKCSPVWTSESKRFGLTEAEVAMTYIRTGETAVTQAVMAVVVGVLGYRNAVAEDVQEEVCNLAAVTEHRNVRMNADKDKIAALQVEIEQLLAANAGANQRATQLREIAEIFRG